MSGRRRAAAARPSRTQDFRSASSLHLRALEAVMRSDLSMWSGASIQLICPPVVEKKERWKALRLARMRRQAVHPKNGASHRGD
jgi:hypothetical protein